MAKTYLLDEELFRFVQKSATERKSTKPKPHGREGAPRFPPYEFLFGKAEEDIAAVDSSGQCESQLVTLWNLNSDGLFVETEDQVHAWNVKGVAVRAAFMLRLIPSPNGLWIVEREYAATHCNALLKGAFTSGGSTVTVDNVTPLDGISPVSSSSDELTASIIFPNWPDADDNAVCKIEWNGDEERWEVYQIDCAG